MIFKRPSIIGESSAEQPTNAGTLSLPYPTTGSLEAGIGAGDLAIIAVWANGSSNLVNTPTGYTELVAQDNVQPAAWVGFRHCDGTESGNVTVTTQDVLTLTASMIIVRGHVIGIDPEASTIATGTDAAPNPNSLTTSWSSDGTLWLQVIVTDHDLATETVDSYSTGFTKVSEQKITGVANWGLSGIARYDPEENRQTLDPDAATLSTANEWVSWTVAVRGYAGPDDTIRPAIFTHTARKSVMAYRWDESTASQVTYDFAPVGEVPATMAIWFYDTLSSYNDRNMIQIQDKEPDNQYFRMHVGETGAGTPTTHKIAIYAKNVTAGDFYASTAIERTQDHWHHACGVFAASNSRTIYIDAGNEGTNTLDAGEMASAVLDSITIGREGDSSPDDSWNGSLVWPAVWNVVLTPSEIKLLASGVSPHLVRPESLKFFAPLDGRPNDMRCLVTGEVPSSITGLTTNSRLNGPPQLQGLQRIPLAVPRANRRVVMF